MLGETKMKTGKKNVHDQESDDRSAKGGPMPDIYTDFAWRPDLEIKDEPSNDADEESGFNPYDTAALHNK